MAWDVIKTDYDKYESKEYFGQRIWKLKQDINTYEGNFLLNSYHTNGTYKWIQPFKTTCYEGTFYANAKEGYGLMSFDNGMTFEGLFHNDRRFGPGVLTYANQTQDVGFWLGSRLVRLTTSVADVPRIGCSAEGKIKMLQFKILVDVSKDNEDLVHNIVTGHLTNIDDNELSEIYSNCVKNPKSLFFNKPLFDKYFFQIFKHLDTFSLEENSDLSLHERLFGVEAEDVEEIDDSIQILAWNNEDYNIDILKQCYKHVIFEETLTYDVENILRCNRSAFYSPGEIESLSIKLLQESSGSGKFNISKLLSNRFVSPDVRDLYGNSPVMIAAANDQIHIITELSKHSANMNSINDEGLTPLGLSLLRYLATLYKVSDWELAFIPQQDVNYEIKNKEWRAAGDQKDVSEESVSDEMVNEVKLQTLSKNSKPQNYIFAVHVPRNKTEYEVVQFCKIYFYQHLFIN